MTTMVGMMMYRQKLVPTFAREWCGYGDGHVGRPMGMAALDRAARHPFDAAALARAEKLVEARDRQAAFAFELAERHRRRLQLMLDHPRVRSAMPFRPGRTRARLALRGLK